MNQGNKEMNDKGQENTTDELHREQNSMPELLRRHHRQVSQMYQEGLHSNILDGPTSSITMSDTTMALDNSSSIQNNMLRGEAKEGGLKVVIDEGWRGIQQVTSKGDLCNSNERGKEFLTQLDDKRRNILCEGGGIQSVRNGIISAAAPPIANIEDDSSSPVDLDFLRATLLKNSTSSNSALFASSSSGGSLNNINPWNDPSYVAFPRSTLVDHNGGVPQAPSSCTSMIYGNNAHDIQYSNHGSLLPLLGGQELSNGIGGVFGTGILNSAFLHTASPIGTVPYMNNGLLLNQIPLDSMHPLGMLPLANLAASFGNLNGSQDVDSTTNNFLAMTANHNHYSKDNNKKRKGKDEENRKKPKRPLSAYNIFFKHERVRILKSLDDDEKNKLKGQADSCCNEVKSDNTKQEKQEDCKAPPLSQFANDYVALDQGASDTDVKKILEAYSMKAAVKKKPSKKASHGKISFEKLAKTIGERWSKLSNDELAMYKHMADEDMKRYKRENDLYLKRAATFSCNEKSSLEDQLAPENSVFGNKPEAFRNSHMPLSNNLRMVADNNNMYQLYLMLQQQQQQQIQQLQMLQHQLSLNKQLDKNHNNQQHLLQNILYQSTGDKLGDEQDDFDGPQQFKANDDEHSEYVAKKPKR